MAEASATSHTTSPTGVAPLAVSNQTATPATAITMAIPKVDLPKPIFSTERERQPYHNMASGPPYPLVIVRSDMRKDTADYAHFCIDKYRDQALCLFPQCGYDITDVWPDAEIQLSGIPFMKEVLKFLTFENVHRARLYARTWAEQNPLELSKLGQGNLSGFYDEKDHLAIVDKIFVKGETAQFPRPFLWHVANIIRHDILAQAAEQAATTRVSTTPGVSGGEPVGHVDSTRPATESMSKAGKAEAAAPNLAIPDRTPRKNNRKKTRSRKKELTVSIGGASQAPSVAMNSTPNVVPSSAPSSYGVPQTQSSSFVPAFPHGQHQPQPYRLAGQPTMMSPYMNAPDPRDSISRDSRQNPSSYNQPGSQPGWIENYRGAQNYGHQSRHPSGNVNVPVNQLPRMNAPISMMQAPMMHPLYPMGPYSQHPAMMPPQMPPAQTHYGVPYGLPYGPPQMGGHVETIAPMSNMHSVVGPSLRSGMPRGDTIQYPYNVQTQHTNQHAGMDRRGSYSRNPGKLYNPKPTEWPDFAAIPEQATLKKSGRSSFSYNGTRNRKLSNSVQNRPGFAPQNVSPVDLNVSYGGNRHADPSFTRNFSTVKPFEVDESITSDTVYGCDETWIGARNEDVKCLWICQLPKDPSETEIMAWFQEFNVVQASSVRLKQDKNHHPYGYIDFSTTDDARKALKFFNNELPQLRGKRVLVKVPEKYYSVQDSSHGQFLSGNSRPFMSASQPARPTPKADEHLPPANDSVQYSPQDARSTLAHDRVRSREAGIPLGSGSPEFPKSKKQQKTPSNKSSLEHMPVRQDSSDASVSAQEQKIEPPVPAIKDINLMDNNHMKNTGTKTSLVVEADQDKRTMEPSGGTSPENENDIVSAEQQKNFHTTEMDSTKTTASLSEKTDLPTASTQFTEPAEVPHVLSSQKKAAREKSVLEENIPEDPTQGDYAQQQDSQAPPLQRGADPLTEEMEKATVTTDAAHSLSVKPGETVPDLQVHTEAASHDEEKNDVSYHAAKETRSDPHLHDEKSDLMAYGESPTENVTTPPIRGPDAVQVSVPSAGISAMPVVTQIASQPAMQPESNNKKEKQGVQQTQFVSDFGMAKTLTKKEREARKKEKKKAKKGDKAPPAFALTQDVPRGAKSPPSQNDLSEQPTATEADAAIYTHPFPMTGNNRKGFFYLGGDERGTVDEGKHPTPPNEVNVEVQPPKVENESSAQTQNQAMGPPAGFYEQESSIHPRGADQKTGKGKGKVAAPDLNLRKPSPNLATVSSHSEPSKTKTKNKKNKAQTTAESDKEPFSEQMCQVDHITSYYRSHPARPEPSPEKRAGFGKVSTNSILDDVHKYIKEKTISAKIQDLYTKQIQRNLPLKRTPITLQKLGETFDPRVDPILQRLENDDEDVPKAGEVPFV